MSRTLSTEANAARLLDEQGADWAWLASISIENLSTGVTDTIRVARFTETVTYSGSDYTPFPFQINELLEDVHGAQTTTEVSLIDPSGEITNFIRDNPITSASVILTLVFDKNQRGAATVGSRDWEAVLSEKYSVQGYAGNFESVTLSLGAVNFLEVKFPHRTLSRDRCSFQYKGTGCGYSGALDSCDFSLDGSNGCRTHGNEARFGGFPSIPLQP
jgi:phage-related protein